MADIDELKQSETVRIVGQDETYAADVIQEGGLNKLIVKSSSELSSDLRIIQEYSQNQNLDDVNYYTIYTVNGVATVSGFSVEFDDKKVWIKLEIDGTEIFDINCEKLKDISNWDNSPQPQTYVSWNDGLKVFYFTPNFPIKSETNITISARSKTGQNKKYLASIVQVG